MFCKGVTTKMYELKNNINCCRVNYILPLDFRFQIKICLIKVELLLRFSVLSFSLSFFLT